MTVLGKILVFVNLVFSVVTAGLIVAVYATSTNWHEAYNKAIANQKVAEANVATYVAEAEEAKKRGDEAVQKVNAELQKIQLERIPSPRN